MALKEQLNKLYEDMIRPKSGISADFFDIEGLKDLVDQQGEIDPNTIHIEQFVNKSAIIKLTIQTQSLTEQTEKLLTSLKDKEAQIEKELTEIHEGLDKKDLSKMGYLTLKNRYGALAEEIEQIRNQENLLAKNILKIDKLRKTKEFFAKQSMDANEKNDNDFAKLITAVNNELELPTPITEKASIQILKDNINKLKKETATLQTPKFRLDVELLGERINEKAEKLGVETPEFESGKTKILDNVVLESASTDQLNNIIGVLTLGRDEQIEKLKKELAIQEKKLKHLDKKLAKSPDEDLQDKRDKLAIKISNLNLRLTEAKGSEDDLLARISTTEEILYLEMLANKIWRTQENLMQGESLSQNINFEKQIIRDRLNKMQEKEESITRKIFPKKYTEKGALVINADEIRQLQERLDTIDKMGKGLIENHLGKLSGDEKLERKKQIQALQSLIEKIETSKKDIRKKRTWSNRNYVAAGVMVGTKVICGILKFIPPLNLIAEPVSKVADLAQTGFISAGNALDPTASEAEKQRARECYQETKRWRMGDAVFGILGSAAVATAAILTVAIVANPVTLAIVTAVGAGTVFLSSFAAIVAAKKELNLEKEIGINPQTKEPYPGHLLRVKGLEQRVNSKMLNTASSFLLCAAAVLAFVAVLSGPLAPVFLLAAGIAVGASAACSAASFYCVTEERRLLVQAEQQARAPIEGNLKKAVHKIEKETNDLADKHGLKPTTEVSSTLTSKSPGDSLDSAKLKERMGNVHQPLRAFHTLHAQAESVPSTNSFLTSQRLSQETQQLADQMNLRAENPITTKKVQDFTKKVESLPDYKESYKECRVLVDKEMNLRLTGRVDHVCNTANKLVEENVSTEFNISGKNLDKIKKLYDKAINADPPIKIKEIQFANEPPCPADEFIKQKFMPPEPASTTASKPVA